MNNARDLLEQRLAADELQANYAACIDEDRLEEWPDFFVEDCTYRITHVQDFQAGRPLGVIYATSKAMLHDRITSLRQANIYEKQRYRHVVSPTRIISHNGGHDGGALHTTTSFLLIRIMGTGDTTIFMSGVYHDILVRSGDDLVFQEKIVVADSASIDTLLAIPV
jgi:anthranilate 1,2-dioxygenase small subunit